MSFDPVTYALCGREKSVRLTDNVAGVVLAAVLQESDAAFSYTFEGGHEKMWKDIVDAKPTNLSLSMDGSDIRISVDTFAIFNNYPNLECSVSGSGLMAFYGITSKLYVAMEATNGGKGVTIYALAEPVEFNPFTLG